MLDALTVCGTVLVGGWGSVSVTFQESKCDESRRVSRVDGVLVSRVWSRVSIGMFYRCVSVVVSEWYSMRDICTA